MLAMLSSDELCMYADLFWKYHNAVNKNNIKISIYTRGGRSRNYMAVSSSVVEFTLESQS